MHLCIRICEVRSPKSRSSRFEGRIVRDQTQSLWHWQRLRWKSGGELDGELKTKRKTIHRATPGCARGGAISSDSELGC